MKRDRRSLPLFSQTGFLRSALMIAALCLLLCGCAAIPSMIKPPLESEGEIFVYFQPLSQEAKGLRFTVDHLSAVRSDGEEFPLSLSSREFDHATTQRQRLLASGRVPPGQYVGLSVTINKASLTGDQGEAAFLTPEGPVRTDLLFEVPKKQAVVLALALRYRESVQGHFRFSPVFSLTVPPRPAVGLTAYATSRNDNHIAVFDKKTGEVAAIIATGRGPEAIAIDQRAGTAYASISGEDAIDVLDITADSIINSIRLSTGDGPRELALTPDGKFLLVVNAASRTLSVIDPRALAELGRVPVGEAPRSVLIDREGRRAYVFNEFSNSITVIDIANRTTVVTLSTDTGPIQGQFNRKGDKLYVIHERSPYLSVIDPVTLSVVRKMFVGPGLSAIKVDTATDMFYICRVHDEVMEMYDPFSLSPAAYIQAMRGVTYMAIDGEENNLYLVSPETRTIMTINLVSRKITALIDAGESPTWVATMGAR
jgi:YVTN family beta-propeller protein